MSKKTIFQILDDANEKAKNEIMDMLARSMDVIRADAPLDSASDIRTALAEARQMLQRIHVAAELLTPDATPEIYNAIVSVRGALHDIGVSDV
jgi:hypothetical protein